MRRQGRRQGRGAGGASANRPAGGYAANAKPAGYAAGGYGYAAKLGDDLDKKVGGAIAQGRNFLASKRDDATGSWKKSVGMTAMAVSAIAASSPREKVADDAYVTKGLDFLAAAQQANGSISNNPQFVNYETSAAVSALSVARIAKYASVQTKARDYLAGSQIAGDENSPAFGGFPYVDEDPKQPPDLSNEQFALQALKDADLPADAPQWKRSLTFLTRVQNHSESNTYVAKGEVDGQAVEVVSGNDGGGIYVSGTGNGEKAGLVKRPDGKYEAKSYGSMTYALLKCLLFAGVPPDDARVKAAVHWISKHWTLDRNPGFETNPDAAKAGQQGYFYYVYTMSRALATYEKATSKPLAVKDEAGNSHDWRKEMAAKLVGLQKSGGFWVNETAERWDEGNPVLATTYVLQALAICQGRLP